MAAATDMTSDRTEDLARFAAQLADAAGAAILPHFRTQLAPENKQTGGGFDPVTIADRAGEAAIRRLINAHYPEHGIIGEEYGRERTDAEFVWVIDPIDGTRAFMSGVPVWGTLIALLQNDRAILGVLDQPFLKERFSGNGLIAERSGSEGRRRLTTRRPVRLADANVSVSSSITHDDAMFARVRRLARSVRQLQFGADCYTVAMLAEGHVDIVIGYGGFEIYDIAAHIPIVTGAGGIVTALDGSDPLTAHDMIAAGDPDCHAAAVAVLCGTDQP
jgi:myo-inositol-1(or 4)-monophosphatase